jgi:hypothetical protein
VKHLLFIVARVDFLLNNIQLVIVVLGGLGQHRNDVEFLVLIESQARCVRDLQLLREQILDGKNIIRLHTRDATWALRLHLDLGASHPVHYLYILHKVGPVLRLAYRL